MTKDNRYLEAWADAHFYRQQEWRLLLNMIIRALVVAKAIRNCALTPQCYNSITLFMIVFFWRADLVNPAAAN